MEKQTYKAGFPTEIVKEGKAKLLVPRLKAFVKLPSEYAPSKAPVFFNPVMELNRDIAVLALQAYQRMLDREILVCEPLTGCGVRGIRFVSEVKGVGKALIGDINERAFELASYNVQLNQVGERITVVNREANSLLGGYGAPHRRFDVIDVDPFGSPAPYLDSAVRALRDGGLLALTATDMAPLCGVHPRACVRKYGGKPLRTEYCHELAVRLLAGCLASISAKHDSGISVAYCHSSDHYIRLYAVVVYGAKKADESMKNMGYILHCFNCFHREIVKEPFPTGYSGECSECGSKLSFAGPLWIGRIFDRQFCERMEKESKRKVLRHGAKVQKVLSAISGEADAPATYYVLDRLSHKLALPMPSIGIFVNAIRMEGFEAFLTHFSSNGIRTDAPAARMRWFFEKALESRTQPR